LEPVVSIRSQTQRIGMLAYGRKSRIAEQFNGSRALELRQVQLDGLRRVGEVMHEQQRVSPVLAYVCEDFVVPWAKKGKGSSPKRGMLFSPGDPSFHPV